MLDQLILIIFGWALGFLSTIGSDRYRKWRQNVSFRMSIKFELDDLRYLAITSAYLVRQRMCTMTPEFARKFSRISESYEKWGLDDPRRIATDALLRLDEKQMADFSYQLNQNRKQGLALKPLQIPYLYANLDKISAIKERDQRHIFEIMRRLSTINEIISEVRNRNAMTFDASISGENHRLVLSDIDDQYRLISKQYESLCDTIDKIVDGTERAQPIR